MSPRMDELKSLFREAVFTRVSTTKFHDVAARTLRRLDRCILSYNRGLPGDCCILLSRIGFRSRHVPQLLSCGQVPGRPNGWPSG